MLALLLTSRQINREFTSILFDHIELWVRLIDLRDSYEQMEENRPLAHLGYKLFEDCTDVRYARGKAILEPLLKQAKNVILYLSSGDVGRKLVGERLRAAEEKCNVEIFDDATWVIQMLNSSKSMRRIVIQGFLNQSRGGPSGLGGLGTEGGTATRQLKSQLRAFDLLRNTDLEIRVRSYGGFNFSFEEQPELPKYIAALKANARRPTETINDSPTSGVE